jgi:phage terminase small subunit
MHIVIAAPITFLPTYCQQYSLYTHLLHQLQSALLSVHHIADHEYD